MIDRLPAHPAQRIDRRRLVRFTFAGREHLGLEGDTIGSALHAAGVRILSRSFKYHRPRGLLCCAGRCAGCLVNVDGVPSVRACVEPVREGMQVRPQHAWPSLEHDVLRVFDRLHRVLPVGFYYKTFIHPRALWPAYERVLRTFAGLGELAGPGEPPGHYEREHAFTDVAVIGGGVAGMAAALEAAGAGRAVVLVDDQPRPGGRWQLSTRPMDGGERAGQSGWDVAAELSARIAAHAGIRVLTGATAFGQYEDGLIGVLQGRTFVKLRARATAVCTGGFDLPWMFAGNDLPGVMLGTAVARLHAFYGVPAGQTALVVGLDGRAHELALDLLAAGVAVIGVADARPPGPSEGQLERRRIPVWWGQTVLEARGRGRVERAVVGGAEGGDGARELACDLIVLAGELEPAAGLFGHAGGRLREDPAGCLVPGPMPSGMFAGGEVVGARGLAAVLATGSLAGAEAALSLDPGDARLGGRVAELRHRSDPGPEPAGRRRAAPVSPRAVKTFVCPCEDVTAEDMHRAIAEGFDHVETLKRYTTVTMGPCQGKMCHRLSVDLCAAATGRTLDETGTTTARPPVQPVPLGALAARQAEPVRLTPMHHRHVALGARLMDMGAWKRPLLYSSIEEECRAVHEAVGLIDVSTLGKLEVTGREAGEYLDWLHPNRFSDLAPGRIRYRIMCDEAGIILDDGVVARLGRRRFLVTTTSGTADAVEQWLEWWAAGSTRCVHVANLTAALAAVNVAGPRSRELLARLTGADLSPVALPYMAAVTAPVAGVPCTILRIGFVGELAYEVYCPADLGAFLWDTLLEAGAPLGVRPFGVEAQRVLRLEKQHVIVSQDTDALTQPFEAGLGALVKLDRPDFIGRHVLGAAQAREPAQRLVGFELDGPAVPPGEGAAVVDGTRPIGRVSSARWSPTLGKVIGLAWLPVQRAAEGATFQVRAGEGALTARVVTRPFYDPDGRRLRS
jgi:sarcosine oxidase subunit alpha